MKLSLIFLILLLGIMLIYYHVTHIEMTGMQLLKKFWLEYTAMTVGVIALILNRKE